MPPSEYDVRVVPSLLDRLIDSDSKSPRDVLSSRAESVRELKRCVQRDLENLLNARNTLYDLPAEFTETKQSVAAYGLPDFSNLNITNPNDRNRLRELIETVIRIFEPRLAGVNVVLISGHATDRSIRFRVEARLVLEPAPEPVTFDMIMQLDNYQYVVKESA